MMRVQGSEFGVSGVRDPGKAAGQPRPARQRLASSPRSALAVLAVIAIAATSAMAAPPPIEIVGRDAAGHGLLLRTQGKRILLVSGTPEQMGAAHGTLLKQQARMLIDRVLYLVGGAETLHSGTWFLDRMEEIQRRTLPAA